MTDREHLLLRGRVHTLETEFAEFDPDTSSWQPARKGPTWTFDREGRQQPAEDGASGGEHQIHGWVTDWSATDERGYVRQSNDGVIRVGFILWPLRDNRGVGGNALVDTG